MSGLDREAFLDGYLAEVEEHLGATARHLATLGEPGQVGAPRAMREVLRSLHTIKGLSAMVAVEPIVELAHAMETLLRAVDRGGGEIPAVAVDALADAVRAMEERLRQVGERKPVAPAPPALLARLVSPAAAVAAPAAPAPEASLLDDPALTVVDRAQLRAAAAAGQRGYRVDVVSTPDRAAAGLTITAVRERLAAIGDVIRVVPRSLPREAGAPPGLAFRIFVAHGGPIEAIAEAAGVEPATIVTIAEAVAPVPVAPAPAPEPEPAALEVVDDPADERGGRYVRVEVSRLDDALERLSALIVTRFRMNRAVAELAARGVDTRRLEEIAGENARQLRDLRAAIMRARMVSVAELLARVPLMVRGLARSTGKAVALTIDAGRAELDKAVGERIFPAIVHLIRNAVDHGIEAPEARRAAGKPRDGEIRVTCHGRSNNQLELTISDDGAGVDAAAVARRAGAPVPDDAAGLLALLARPGLSTRAEATTTSGRGLGVDIVQRLVRELGGDLELSTRPGHGTTFTLRIPLSITIVNAFSFEAGGHVFVVPVGSVDEIVEVDPALVTRTPPRPELRAEVSLIDRRGAAVPMVDLDEVLALPAVERAPLAPGLHPKAILVQRGGAPYAFRVDRMLGQQEVVVRPVVDELVRVPGITGSTDLGEGRPILVLDLLALTDRLTRAAAGRRAEAGP